MRETIKKEPRKTKVTSEHETDFGELKLTEIYDDDKLDSVRIGKHGGFHAYSLRIDPADLDALIEAVIYLRVKHRRLIGDSG